MINGSRPHLYPRSYDVVKTGFDDWVELLEHTNNKDMLNDPYNVWLEAFHVGTLIERHGILHAIQTQVELAQPIDDDMGVLMKVDDVKQLQINLLKQVMELIASKGLSRPNTQ